MPEDEHGEEPIPQELIARRAFEIWLTNGTTAPEENWARAEQELREEAARARRQSGRDRN